MVMVRKRWATGAAVLLLAIMLGVQQCGHAGDKPAPGGNAPKTVAWEDLVPKDWDPLKKFRDRNVGRIGEGSASELALMREMRALWDNAPTRRDLDGASVRLPGYVVPLEAGDGQLKEFLLVPYFGACVHSPPPPANQIVHVLLPASKPLHTMDAVWVSGTLKTLRQDSPWGMSGYSLQGIAVEPYTRAAR